MRALSLVAVVLGAALVVAMVQSMSISLPALLALGGVPLLSASAYRVVTLVLNTRSWQLLLPPGERPPFLTLLRLRWIGEAINTLLPVAQVGGDLVRARLLTRPGLSGATATTGMLGDLMVGVLSQWLFTLMGVAALAAGAGLGPLSPAIATGLALLAATAVGLGAIIRLGQRPGFAAGWLGRWLAARWRGVPEATVAFEVAMAALLRRRRELAAALSWHLAGWLSQVGETSLVLLMLGNPVSWRSALIIESLAATARGAAFFVPGGLGVQEAAVVALGLHLGVPLDTAVTLGVVKRLREVVVGGPALLVWMLSARARRAPGSSPPGGTS